MVGLACYNVHIDSLAKGIIMHKATQDQVTVVDAILRGITEAKPVVTQASAGTGKTQTLAYANTEALKRGMHHNVIAVAFNVDAAKELAKRLPSWEAKTRHALGKAALHKLTGQKRFKVDASKYFFGALRMLGNASDNEEKRVFRYLASKAAEAVDLVHTRLVDVAEAVTMTEVKPEAANHVIMLTQALLSWGNAQTEAGSISFSDMLYYPVLVAQTSGIDRLFSYDALIVDEAQDTNAISDAFFTLVVKPQSLILIGDTKQTVNIWNGAIAYYLDLKAEAAITATLPQSFRIPQTTTQALDRFGFVGTTAHPDNPQGDYAEVTADSLATFAQRFSGDNAWFFTYKNAELAKRWLELTRKGIVARFNRDNPLPQQLVTILSSVADMHKATREAIYAVNAEAYDADILDAACAFVDGYDSTRDAIDAACKAFGITLCPVCGSVLVKRTSKNGYAFFGCSNYPACKHTQSYTEAKLPQADITLSTVHTVKGLTVKHSYVALDPELANGDLQSQSVLYVAITRHTQTLWYENLAEA